jgi:hypothetical protein
MAIAFDASSKHERNDPPANSAVTWSHTCTGTNRLLVVAVGHFNPASVTPSLPTYNGVSMTQLATFSPQNAEIEWAFYYLVNPASGTNTISAGYSGDPTQFYGHAVSYTGVEQTPTIVASGGTTGAGVTSLSRTLTGLTVGDLIIGVFGGSAGGASGGTGVTERAVTTNDQSVMGEMIATGSSETISFNGANSNWNIIAAAFAPAGGGAPAFRPRVVVY